MAEQTGLKAASHGFRLGFTSRLFLLTVLLFAEKIALSMLVDTQRARDAEGLGGFLRLAQHWGFRFLVTFVAAASVFAFVRSQQTPKPAARSGRSNELNYRWLIAHGLLLATLAPLSHYLFSDEITTTSGLAAMAVLWISMCAIAVVAAAAGIISPAVWRDGIRSMGSGWTYAAGVALLGTAAWASSERLWKPATAFTFKLVSWILMPVLPLSYANPATRVIATPRFAVEITEVCSGLEGLGLTLSFCMGWLVYYRREYIFPRALLLVPIALATMFCLNALRIAALLMIGDAGYPDVASFGFHSQAGWIAFNAVACAVAFFSRRSPWLNRTAGHFNESERGQNPTAAYLVPLLAILAAGTISHALSGRFETLYPLRLIAAGGALFTYRRELLSMRWKATWRGPAIGVGVFLLWFAAARWVLPPADEPSPLAAMMPLRRSLWILSHCLTSIVLVPVAEELAYRGYLMRRITAVEFETASYRSVRWPALLVSAVAFGAAHGALWPAGIVAGVAYGLLAIRHDSLDEPIAAHASTNALIAIAVVAGGQWQLW